jgi:hypothetical protein
MFRHLLRNFQEIDRIACTTKLEIHPYSHSLVESVIAQTIDQPPSP